MAVYRPVWIGTDGRTLLSAHVTATARSANPQERYDGIVMRGTPGMREWCRQERWPVRFMDTDGVSAVAYARATARAFERGEIDCAIPMPEALQFDGFVDMLIAAGYGDRVIGLLRAHAFLEGDKIAAKQFCKDGNIPVADFWDFRDARDFREIRHLCLGLLRAYGGVVLKYPYRAAGKGGRVVLDVWGIHPAWASLMHDYENDWRERCGDDAWPLLMESRMSGVEISFTALVDGRGNWQLLPSAMDYPERFAGVRPGLSNPITGGMAALSPHPMETPELMRMANERIFAPLVSLMQARGMLRPCILYPSGFVSLDADMRPTGIRLCEINIRPPEPEWRVMIKRVRNLGELVRATVEGRLDEVQPEVREDQISMTMALVIGPGPEGYRGYPWRYKVGESMVIDAGGLPANIMFVPSAVGYDTGTNRFVSNGSRVGYLIGNAAFGTRSRRSAAEYLSDKIKEAYRRGNVRVIPPENPDGNRLAIRDDAGAHFALADELFEET